MHKDVQGFPDMLSVTHPDDLPGGDVPRLDGGVGRPGEEDLSRVVRGHAGDGALVALEDLDAASCLARPGAGGLQKRRDREKS